jgi:hypothetical protein
MMSQLLLYLFLVTPFFLYVISARTYRKELALLFYKVLQLRGATQLYPSTNAIMPINRTAHRLSSIR